MLSSRCGTGQSVVSSSRRASQPTRNVVARAHGSSSRRVVDQLLSGTATAAAALALLGSAANAAELQSLADVMRPQFEFVDANKDGIVTMGELKALSTQVAEEEGFAQPADEQLAFTLRLFDLNQDGQLTTNEMLTSLALDAVVTEDAIDADAVKVFDTDGDGFVERKDWPAPFGDLGRQGEVVKEYIFDRVDHLSDSNGKLDTQELVNALNLVRTVALGY